MDVERTMQFILDSQAQLTTHGQVVDERLDRLTGTLEQLQSFIDNLNKGRNGHP